MERITNIEEAKKKMEKSVNFYKCRIEAWEAVTRNRTKTGEAYKILSKNFNNCTFEPYIGDRAIFVKFTDENGHTTRDNINLAPNMYIKGFEEAAETPEAVQMRIDRTIENYKKWYETDKRGLAEIEKQLKEIEPELKKLKEAIKAAKETNTQYTMQSYIKNYLNILNEY